MAELNQIDVSTKRYIKNTPKLIDFVFQEGPLIAYAKQNVREDYDGGRYIGENFFYGGLIGGSYQKGKTFDITQPQVEQQLQFQPKFFEIDVTLYKEDIQVINKGPNAAFKLIESRMTNAYMTIGAHLEIARAAVAAKAACGGPRRRAAAATTAAAAARRSASARPAAGGSAAATAPLRAALTAAARWRSLGRAC